MDNQSIEDRAIALEEIIPRVQDFIRGLNKFDRVRVYALPPEDPLYYNYICIKLIMFKWGIALESTGMILDELYDPSKLISQGDQIMGWIKSMEDSFSRTPKPEWINNET